MALRPGEKVVVTQQGIDDWKIQLYGYRLDSVPKVKPDNMPEHVYDEFKKKYRYGNQT